MLKGEIVPGIVYAGSRALISQQKQHKGEGGPAVRSVCTVNCSAGGSCTVDAGGMTRAKKKNKTARQKDERKKKSNRGQTTPAVDKADGTWEN